MFPMKAFNFSWKKIYLSEIQPEVELNVFEVILSLQFMSPIENLAGKCFTVFFELAKRV